MTALVHLSKYRLSMPWCSCPFNWKNDRSNKQHINNIAVKQAIFLNVTLATWLIEKMDTKKIKMDLALSTML
jgi:hypothetical protein